MKELILNGGIEPGRTVTIQSLADAFGVSAMPVREALHRLVAEKALTVVAGRSVGIPPLNIDRLEDLTRARIEIEGGYGMGGPRDLSRRSGEAGRSDRHDGSRPGGGRRQALRPGQPGLPFHGLPSGRVGNPAVDHRVPMAPHGPLLRPAERRRGCAPPTPNTAGFGMRWGGVTALRRARRSRLISRVRRGLPDLAALNRNLDK